VTDTVGRLTVWPIDEADVGPTMGDEAILLGKTTPWLGFQRSLTIGSRGRSVRLSELER
jgi:hypothetical protein